MRIVDLSLPVDNNMPGVNIQTARKLDEDGWNATTLEMYSHSGTHMDAPKHFLPGGDSLDEQDLNALVGPAHVVHVAPAEPKQLIGVQDLGALAEEIEPGARLLFRTDWYPRYGTEPYRHELPRISLELAAWCVEKQVALIGVEPPSVADVNNIEELTEVHQTLFRARIVIVEGLANLDKLTSSEVEFIALPLKIMDGDGCPVRAIAIERETL